MSAVVVTVLREVEPLNISMAIEELGSAVPVIVGVESLVVVEEVAKEVGASGTVVSIVIEIDEDFEEILPAASVTVTFIEYVPSGIGVGCV